MRRLLWFFLTATLLCAPAAWGQQLIQGQRTIVGWFNACNATGAGNAFTCALDYPLPAYVDRQCFTLKANHTISGSATVNVDSKGVKTIKKYVSGSAATLAANDIVAGQYVLLCYDGTDMQAVALGAAPSSGGGGAETLTYAAGVKLEGVEVSTASQEPGFLFPGTSDLTAGGGEGGKMQTRTDGSLEYTDNASLAVRHRGFLLPHPLTYNLDIEDCTEDENGGKVTFNVSGQMVCGPDISGGVGGPGDITGVGDIVSGPAGTTGFPLSRLWWLETTQPSPPAATQGLGWLDSTSKNFGIITSDGVVKRMVQSIDPTEHFFLTALAADGSFSAARPSSAALTDSATLVKLDAAQRVTNKQNVPRHCQLSAASGTVIPNGDGCDVVWRHDVDGAMTIDDPTVTSPNPAHFQPILLSFYAAAEQTLTWDTGYAAGSDVQLPTVIPAGKYLRVLVRYDPTSTKWEAYSVVPGAATVTQLDITGSTSGVVSLVVSPEAGTYDFWLPTTAGTTGQPLLSGGGAGPQTYGPLNLAGGAGVVTGVLPNANTTAASANTASALVARDGSGNFSAGTITAALSGNASTATALAANPSPCDVGDFVTDIAADGTLTCDTPAGGGTGTIHLSVGGYSLPSSNPAQLDASENNLRLLFDASTSECAIWQGTLNADYASGLTLKASFSMTSATSGTFNLDVSIMAVTPGDSADINTDSYDTANNCDDAGVPGTAGHLDQISCSLTNADSIAAGDYFKIKMCRDTGDTAAGDAEVVHARLEYTR
jgi:hypothetical protein